MPSPMEEMIAVALAEGRRRDDIDAATRLVAFAAIRWTQSATASDEDRARSVLLHEVESLIEKLEKKQ